MAMTREEKATKNYIYQKLREQGYPTYASIFGKLDLHLTANPRVVGYMTPKDGSITINRNLEEDQFSVIIRHEILHNYLRHEKRLLDHLAEKRGINPDDLDDLTLNELKNYLYGDDTFNIAADYEISNRGYTEEDKQTIRAILLNGETLSGLVTEDKHPNWVNWDVEDMYDALLDEKEQAEQDAKQDMQDQQDQDSDDDQSNDDQSGDDNSQSSSGNSGNSSSNQSQGDDGEEGDPTPPSNNKQQNNQSSSSNNSNSNNSSDPSQNNSSSNQQSSGKSNSSGNSGESGNSSGGNSSESEDRPIVYGKFIDENTFVDQNGNVITIGG